MLVYLQMDDSYISQLWGGGERKVLNKLRFLELSCSYLISFDLGMTPNLETLDLGGCKNLVELHVPFECPKLKSLSVRYSKVSNLNLVLIPNLETLDLVDCKNFVEFHMLLECPKLKFLYLSGLKLSNFNLGLTPNILKLDLSRCNNLVELHMLVEFPHLKYLNLSNSKEILAPMGCLKNLFHLNLSGCNSFAYFWFDNRYYEPLPLSSGNVEKLISSGLCACTFLESFSATICGLQCLGELTLTGSIPEAPKDLWQLEGLEKLTLCMKEIKHLPDNICMLKHLKSLKLKSCWLLEQLPKDLGKLESLEVLDLTEGISLRDIPNSICNMKCLKSLNLSFCIRVENLPGELRCLKCLELLNIEGSGISRLPHSMFQLKYLCIVWSWWRLLSYGFTCLNVISEYTASSYVHQRYEPIEVLSGNRC
ncbi:putative leucine-rich repeat domain superfamily [Helianthus annuus]|nr:putative leucine-rich repeat domain superfamily [Helianthus annuus]